MKKFLLFFPVLLYLTFFSVSSDISGQTFLMKDSILNKLSVLKDQTHVKALIAGIWSGDQEILTVALGESMTNVPASVDMHFRIGGVTETMFGTLVMQLVEQGKFTLDDKISKWLPDLLAADKVTVGMLIRNTAGYKDYVFNKDFLNLIEKEPFRYLSSKEIIGYSTGGNELDFPPGTKQKYSHTSFTILGEILQRATGKSMTELYEENIFRPLGLNHTGHNGLSAELPFPVLHAYSSDRGIYEDASFWSPSWTQESGPVYSTISDLGKWARTFGTGSLLTKASFDELVRRPEGADHPDVYMASGFVVSNGWYWQNPSFNGYSGGFGYMPSKELTIIVFTTESEDPKSSAQAFNILKELTKMITPEATIHF